MKLILSFILFLTLYQKIYGQEDLRNRVRKYIVCTNQQGKKEVYYYDCYDKYINNQYRGKYCESGINVCGNATHLTSYQPSQINSDGTLKPVSGNHNQSGNHTPSPQPQHVTTEYNDPNDQTPLNANNEVDTIAVYPNVKDPITNIYNIRISHDALWKAKKGMMITSDLYIGNLKAVPLRLRAYFFYENGAPIANDNDHKFDDEKNNVVTGFEFIPSNIYSVFHNFRLFLPYDELEIQATGSALNLKLNLSLEIIKPVTVINTSDFYHFTMQ